jgi:hypothetical protein
MKTTHTPGPYAYDETWALIHGKDGAELAACHSNKADAAFIVRACNSHYELLAALEALQAACLGASLPRNMMIHLTEARATARAAIAKAKG